MVNKGPVYAELKHQLDVKESRILQVLFTYFTENNRWPEPREITSGYYACIHIFIKSTNFVC